MLWVWDGMDTGQKPNGCLSSVNACASPSWITKSLGYLGRQLVRLMLAVKFCHLLRLLCVSQSLDHYFKLPVHWDA